MREIVEDLRACRKQLVQLRDSSRYPVEQSRAAICLSYAYDPCVARVARALQRARSTIYLALRRFANGGIDGLRDGRRLRRSPMPDRGRILAALPDIVSSSPQDLGYARSTWTVELVAAVVVERFGVRVSRTQMWRMLRQAGCKRLRPQPTVAKAPSDRRKRIGRLVDVLLRIPDDEPIFFSDESTSN